MTLFGLRQVERNDITGREQGVQVHIADSRQLLSGAAVGVDLTSERERSCTEPPVPQDHPLFGAPNLLATPHVAFATHESMVKRAAIR